METRLSKTIVAASMLLFVMTGAYAQQNYEEEDTVIPIDSIYLENQGNKLALNKITTKSIRGFLGKPTSVFVYDEKWSDEYDKQITYKYGLLMIMFKSFENEEWLDYIECSNPNIPIVVNNVRLFTGMKDSVLNMFKKSWKNYQKLGNTKYYQDKLKQGDSTKTLIIDFPIKTKSGYEYLGSIYIHIKEGSVVDIKISFQDS